MTYPMLTAPSPVYSMILAWSNQGGGSCVMGSNSSSAASARVAIAVAIALQSVNTSEASRCQLHERSLNRLFVLEFVKCLCIGAPPKGPAQKRFVVFWHFRETRETREFPSQTTTSGSQLGGGEINIRDPSSTPSFNSMEQPFDDAAMLHFIRDCLFRSDSPLHHEFWSLLEKFIAERIAGCESELFPCMSRDLHSLSQKLADTEAKVMELEQRIDALQTSAANAITATDHRVDILQSSTENPTQAAVSELRRSEHELLQCYVLLNEFAQVLCQQPSNHFQFPQQQPQQQPQPQPQPSPSSYPLLSPSNSPPFPPHQPPLQPPLFDPSMDTANPMNQANPVHAAIHQANPANAAIPRVPTLEIMGCRVERLHKLIRKFSGEPRSGEFCTWQEDLMRAFALSVLRRSGDHHTFPP